MQKLRIVFMGSPEFAVPSLEAVNVAGHELVAVVTGTDKRRGRGNELSATPVKKRALELGIPVIEADSMRDQVVEDRLRSLHADLFIVVAFKVLPKSLLRLPKIGSINVHASLLPKYRGAAPIHWAIKRGETETGVTIFFLDEQVDTGKYLLQVRVPIGAEDTTGDIYRVLMHVGAESLGKAVAMISAGTFTLTAQDDSQATPAPKLFQEDAKIDYSWSAQEMVNHVRAMNPFPMAWVYLDGKKLKVLRVRCAEREGRFPEKTITVDEHRMILGTRDGYVEFLEVQMEGKKVTRASDFIRGYQGACELA
jgi:methionyl-tRNA formyltransferase